MTQKKSNAVPIELLNVRNITIIILGTLFLREGNLNRHLPSISAGSWPVKWWSTSAC